MALRAALRLSRSLIFAVSPECESVYELALRSLKQGGGLSARRLRLPKAKSWTMTRCTAGKSEWRLLAPIDVPGMPSRLMVAGTGLTHLGSAKERQAMHLADKPKEAEAVTDSMRMFQWGVEGGRPKEGEIGIAPEWFYKGTGAMLRAPFEPLTVPAYARRWRRRGGACRNLHHCAKTARPIELGWLTGNEFSDHQV